MESLARIAAEQLGDVLGASNIVVSVAQTDQTGSEDRDTTAVSQNGHD